MNPLSHIPTIKKILAFAGPVPTTMHKFSCVNVAWRDTVVNYSDEFWSKPNCGLDDVERNVVVCIIHNQFDQALDLLGDNAFCADILCDTVAKLTDIPHLRENVLKFLSDHSESVCILTLILRLLRKWKVNDKFFRDLLPILARGWGGVYDTDTEACFVEEFYMTGDYDVGRFLRPHIPDNVIVEFLNEAPNLSKRVNYLINCGFRYKDLPRFEEFERNDDDSEDHFSQDDEDDTVERYRKLRDVYIALVGNKIDLRPYQE